MLAALEYRAVWVSGIRAGRCFLAGLAEAAIRNGLGRDPALCFLWSVMTFKDMKGIHTFVPP
jgi:hypothetical protein